MTYICTVIHPKQGHTIQSIEAKSNISDASWTSQALLDIDVGTKLAELLVPFNYRVY